MRNYQNWFYRIGLVGLVAIGVIAATSLRDLGTKTNVQTEAPSTVPTTGTSAPPLTTPPGAVAFSVSTPYDQAHYNTAWITVVGQGPVGANVAVGGAQTTVTPTGSFSTVILLGLGANPLSVVVTTADGQSSTIALTVFYDLPVSTTVPTHAPSGSGSQAGHGSSPGTTKPPTSNPPPTTGTTQGTTPPPPPTTTTTVPEG